MSYHKQEQGKEKKELERDNFVLLQAKDICKEYSGTSPVSILKNVSLLLRRGDSVAIMGRSGEGKTTLLHILGTLETPSHGTLSIAQQEAGRHNYAQLRNKHIGFIFQSFHLLEHYTTLENVLMPAKIARQPVGSRSVAYQRASQLLDRVGLSPRSHFQTKLLSGGEKQRAAIARALMNDPDIILADEPTGNLDHTTSQQVQDLLFDCLKEAGKALVIVTHDKALAARCHYRYQLQEGCLISEGA